MKIYTYILLCILFIYGCKDNKETFIQKELKPYTLDNLIPLANKNPDSIVNTLKLEYQIATKKNDTRAAIKSLMLISTVYSLNEEYRIASDYAGEALFLAEEKKDTFAIANCSKKLGVLNYTLHQKENAITLLNKTLNIYKANKGRFPSIDKRILESYHSLSLFHNYFQEHELSQQYLDSCFYIIKNTNREIITPISLGFLETQQAKTHLVQRNYGEAITILKKTAKKFENIKENEKSSFQKDYLLIIYTQLAKAYSFSKQNDLAQFYFDKAYNLDAPRYSGYKIHTINSYSNFSRKIKNYKKAYELLREYKRLTDDRFSTKSEKNHGFVTIRNKYLDKIEQNNKELAHKENELLKFRIVLLSILLVSLISVLIIRTRYIKQKHRSESKRIKIDQERIKKDLIQKNRELTASTLKHVENEKKVNALIEYIELTSNDKKPNIIKTIKNNSTNIWDEFNSRFTEVNKDFYSSLNKINPNLTSSELKLCALIKLNFSSKEIAHLIGISDASVNTARYRLRKKLNLNKEDNLTSYINTI